MKEPQVIEIPRTDITLVQLTEKDAEAVFDLVRSNVEHFRRFIPEISDLYCSIEEVARRLSENDGYTFGIWDKKELVGSTGVLVVNEEEPPYGMIGYYLGEGKTGKGYATRATIALTRHMFDEDIDILYARINPANSAAIKVIRRAGYNLTDFVTEEGEIIFGAEKEGWLRNFKKDGPEEI